ncbi:MAG: recombinase family protein [Alphaproteobacteria bacterium]|nr:recombinase family protein [Alphaproteobacteria bacterium]
MARLYGYSRVSTSDQDWSLQLDALAKVGVDDRDIYREKMSGTKSDRVELRRVIDLLREGDKLIVWRLDRLARSQLHLLEIAKEIEDKGAELVSIMDNIDTTTATGKMLFGILSVLAEFERNLTVERSKAGQAIARKNGKKFGRPQKLTPSLIRQIKLAHEDKQTTMIDTCLNLGISKGSYYNALKMREAAK